MGTRRGWQCGMEWTQAGGCFEAGGRRSYGGVCNGKRCGRGRCENSRFHPINGDAQGGGSEYNSGDEHEWRAAAGPAWLSVAPGGARVGWHELGEVGGFTHCE